MGYTERIPADAISPGMRIEITERPDLPATAEVLVRKARRLTLGGESQVEVIVEETTGQGHRLVLHAGDEFRVISRPSRLHRLWQRLT